MGITRRYTVANGRMIAVSPSTGTRRFFRLDPLGSVVSLYNDSLTRTNDYTYWSYGGVRSGSLITDFLYGGGWGYRKDYGEHYYILAREYDSLTTRWMTVDPIWPWEIAYGYANQSPTCQSDPSGLLPLISLIGLCEKLGYSKKKDPTGCRCCFSMEQVFSPDLVNSYS